jgi:uncharacterized protein
MARGILSQLGFTEDEIEPIAHVIEAHSRYGGPDPQTIEAKILQDADAVEYVGAIGLARAFPRTLESGDYSGDVEESLFDKKMERVYTLARWIQGEGHPCSCSTNLTASLWVLWRRGVKRNQ